MKQIDKISLKESILDTSIALPIAWGMSYLTLISMYAFAISDAFYLDKSTT